MSPVGTFAVGAGVVPGLGVAVGAAEAVRGVDAQPLEQRMVDAVERQMAVAQQQPDVLAVLDDRAEVGAPQPVAEEPELDAAEAVVEQRMEGDDADMGVGQPAAIVEPLGVVVLHVEVHLPRDLLVEPPVERLDPLAVDALAEEHRVGEDVVFGANLLEAVILGEEVDHQEVLRAVVAARKQPRQFAPERGAVGQQHELLRGAADHPGAADVVAEVLLHGHRREVEERIEGIAEQSNDSERQGHGLMF